MRGPSGGLITARTQTLYCTQASRNGRCWAERKDAGRGISLAAAACRRDNTCMSAAPSPVRISVEEYLDTSYRPDCDYVNGEIEERNVGEKDHAIVQRVLTMLFGLK